MSTAEQSGATVVQASAENTTTNQLPPQPVVPPNVTEVGLPSRSDSVFSDGSTLDYVPWAIYCQEAECSGKVTSIGDNIIGIMAPDGTVHQPKWSFDGNMGDLLYVLMVNPRSAAAQGTIIQLEEYWQLLTSSIVPADTPHTTTWTVTSGISQTQAETMSFSIGAQVGFNDGITGNLSTELSKSFSESVTVSEQQSISEEFPFNPQPQEQVCGIYQLMQTYSIIPGENLQKALMSVWANEALQCSGALPISAPCKISKITMPFAYPANQLLQVWGVDTDTTALKATMSLDELKTAVGHTTEK